MAAGTLDLPGNLGSTGWPVLWVSRPGGIEWKVEGSAVANRHPGPPPAAMDQHPLIKLLLVDEMFDRVRQTLKEVPGRVASPGLWLAGAEDEAATFAGALAVAIRRVCESGAATDDPFAELAPGPGRRREPQRDRADRGLPGPDRKQRQGGHACPGGLGGLGGMIKRGDNGVLRYVSRVGQELGGLRDLVAQVFQDGSVTGGTELTGGQGDLVRDAGLGSRPARRRHGRAWPPPSSRSST